MCFRDSSTIFVLGNDLGDLILPEAALSRNKPPGRGHLYKIAG